LRNDTLQRTPRRPGTAAIDPRIRARRIEVARDAGRRRLQRLADVVVLAVVAAGFALAVRSPLLDVDAVVVEGAERTGTEAVLAAAGVRPGDQLLDVDVAAVARRVGEFPWVGEAAVRRSLGGEVRIAVTERRPVAVVGDGGRSWLVDAQGAVLADAGAQWGDLPRLTGAVGRLSPGAVVAAGAAPALAERLVAALPGGAVTELRHRPELVAVLAVGGEVRFGDETQLDAKLLALATMLAEVDLAGLERIDLRAPGNPVLTRSDP
jgi:cell division protein FtsQ